MSVTGGKATKTGMVLARAQLSMTQTGVVAAQERQSALLGKGKYRKAETVAREAPVGTLATKDMPKRKGMKGSEADFKKRFGTWMRTALSAKVRLTRAERRGRAEGRARSYPARRAWQVKQARVAAAYEKMALRMNAWMVEQDYMPFARTVEVSSGRYRLELKKRQRKHQNTIRIPPSSYLL